MADGGFALTATHFFYKRQKKVSKKTLAPACGTSLRSVFPRSGIHLGASPTVCFATTSSRCVRLCRPALRAFPPDEHLHSAFRRGLCIKVKFEIKIKGLQAS
jgi:hypothetical protein